MADDELRILFGPGGFVRLVHLGEHDVEATEVDLTGIAADLAVLGIERARAVARPDSTNGYVEVDLGDGGRVRWPAGGGDLDEDDVAAAIAAALEQIDPDTFTEIVRREQARTRQAGFDRLRQTLTAAGLNARQVGPLLGSHRRRLDGRSVRDVMCDPDADEDLRRQAVDTVLDAVQTRGLLQQFSEAHTRIPR